MTPQDFINSLQAPAAFEPLGDAALSCNKEDLLVAEVFLPVPIGTSLANIRTVRLRPPFQSAPRLVVVDISRLRAP